MDETAEGARLREVWRGLRRRPAEDEEAAEAADARGVGPDPSELAPFRDHWAMRRADVLAASNSTFSLTAAMLHHARADGSEPAEFWRPVPAAHALRPFGPWNTQPLLPCTDAECAELYGERGGYE